jgi:transposase
MDADGEKLASTRIVNDPVDFAKVVSEAPVGSDVVIEATYGWYWAADLLRDLRYVVHLANPHGNDWGHRRVKNDERDEHMLEHLPKPAGLQFTTDARQHSRVTARGSPARDHSRQSSTFASRTPATVERFVAWHI